MVAAYRLPISKGVWFMAATCGKDKDWRRKAKEREKGKMKIIKVPVDRFIYLICTEEAAKLKVLHSEVYKRTHEKWGMVSQLHMAIEECAELQLALCKFMNRGGSKEAVITEIADVKNLVESLMMIFGEQEVLAEQERKLLRLKGKLDR